MNEPYDETIVEIDRSYDGWHPARARNEFTWHAPTARVYVSKSLASIPGFRYPRWVVSALCGTGATHRMGETAAKVLASSAVELVTAPGLLKQAKEKIDERQRQQQIEPLVPLGL
jgi:hypothetical protein